MAPRSGLRRTSHRVTAAPEPVRRGNEAVLIRVGGREMRRGTQGFAPPGPCRARTSASTTVFFYSSHVCVCPFTGIKKRSSEPFSPLSRCRLALCDALTPSLSLLSAFARARLEQYRRLHTPQLLSHLHSARLLPPSLKCSSSPPHSFHNEVRDDYFCCGGGKRERANSCFLPKPGERVVDAARDDVRP